MPIIQFREADISLYQDLSDFTLDTRRALCTIMSAFREKRIPYRWGFHFSLQTKQGSNWVSVCWPEDILSFLRELHLPLTRIRNCILEDAIMARRDPLTLIHPYGRRPTQKERGGPNSPEE
ncbi:Hypothetical predicted protein [Pelobates cultripes]|uniref:Uncharacterized protein n=1 Tax=Pelobates cultripes TaxID=61616 RepID=A0AAD1RZ10_PELCU|nr:Hypothetical predicted protein [Pelobates cultripes]